MGCNYLLFGTSFLAFKLLAGSESQQQGLLRTLNPVTFFFWGGLAPILNIKLMLLIASGGLLLTAPIYFLFFILSSAPKLCLFVSGT